MMKKYLFIVFAAVVYLFTAAISHAMGPVNVNAKGVAIKGYDAVAYFSQEDAVEGNPEFRYEWEGAVWHFSSEENKAKFEEDPQKYSPQYGGYCAYAVTQGSKADISPEAFTIYKEKLYLNVNNKVKRFWEKNKQLNIKSADTKWPEIR